MIKLLESAQDSERNEGFLRNRLDDIFRALLPLQTGANVILLPVQRAWPKTKLASKPVLLTRKRAIICRQSTGSKKTSRNKERDNNYQWEGDRGKWRACPVH